MRTVPRQAPPRGTNVVPRGGILPPMVAVLPIAGLVASSSAQRLKPHAIDIRVNIDPVHWFLSPPRDTRSSLYLEDAATEFQVQGLELDWTKSHVGRRLTLEWERLELSQFSRGPKDEISRTDVKKPERRQYLKNAYRVLLTRARCVNALTTLCAVRSERCMSCSHTRTASQPPALSNLTTTLSRARFLPSFLRQYALLDFGV
jgi:hypothetical protein